MNDNVNPSIERWREHEAALAKWLVEPDLTPTERSMVEDAIALVRDRIEAITERVQNTLRATTA